MNRKTRNQFSVTNNQFACLPDSFAEFLRVQEKYYSSDFSQEKVFIDDIQSTDQEAKNGILIIELSGIAFKEENIFTLLGFGFSYEGLQMKLEQAQAMDSVREVILRIDSPGGVVSGISDAVKTINDFTKPINAHVDSLAASAAYWIASACDSIACSETAKVGSIGVIVTFFSNKVMMENLGIKEITLTSKQSPFKGFDPDSDSDLARVQKMIDKLADIFITSVAENRETSIESVLSDFGKGDTLLANDALAVGMIDSIMVFNDFLQKKSNNPLTAKKNRLEIMAKDSAEENKMAEEQKIINLQAKLEERERALVEKEKALLEQEKRASFVSKYAKYANSEQLKAALAKVQDGSISQEEFLGACLESSEKQNLSLARLADNQEFSGIESNSTEENQKNIDAKILLSNALDARQNPFAGRLQVSN